MENQITAITVFFLNTDIHEEGRCSIQITFTAHLFLTLFGFHLWKEDDIPDRILIRQQHS